TNDKYYKTLKKSYENINNPLNKIIMRL
ncbi:MAG: hypothetical protein PWQ14_1396, partial [Rikenellaceae bacterium]|nr:hypothetical protein [Rikenellaceae bacterium]